MVEKTKAVMTTPDQIISRKTLVIPKFRMLEILRADGYKVPESAPGGVRFSLSNSNDLVIEWNKEEDAKS